MALWEIVGRHTSPAFLVPLSETLMRLWELAARRHARRTDTRFGRICSSTGFVLSLLVGMPVGLLLARVAVLRVALDPYIMILYATPMVALIPFILSLMGFGFVPKVLVVFLFARLPRRSTTRSKARAASSRR